MKIRIFAFISILLLSTLFLSFTGTAQWVQSGGLENQSVSSIVASGKNLIAGVWGGFLYLSIDSGATWTQLDRIARIYFCPDCGFVLIPSISLFANGSDIFCQSREYR